MDEQEMQRKMGFIVEQQAQFTVDIQQLRESQGKLTDAVIGVVGIVGKLAERVDGLVGRVEEIAEAQKRTDAQIAETNAQLAETDERLNIFISVVERYISERRNGSGPQSGDQAAPSA